MELINKIADYFETNTSSVKNITVVDGKCWFSIGKTEYTCSIVRGKFLKKNSIRLSVA